MVWLRRCTHYLFIVVVAVNSTLLTINAGDYIFYTDWAWTSFVVFSISQTLMLTVADPLETAFKYPRPTLPPYMTPIEPQVGKFYNSPVALGAGAGAVLSV